MRVNERLLKIYIQRLETGSVDILTGNMVIMDTGWEDLAQGIIISQETMDRLQCFLKEEEKVKKAWWQTGYEEWYNWGKKCYASEREGEMRNELREEITESVEWYMSIKLKEEHKEKYAEITHKDLDCIIKRLDYLEKKEKKNNTGGFWNF